MKKIIYCVCVFLIALQAQAEVLTWVDKDGKKHYGDKVPAEYANQTKTVDVKPVNGMDAVKTSKVRTPPPSSRNTQNSAQTPPANTDAQNMNRCEAQIQAYKRSEACYAKCNEGSRALRVRNVASCQCEDVKKPDPDCRP